LKYGTKFVLRVNRPLLKKTFSYQVRALWADDGVELVDVDVRRDELGDLDGGEGVADLGPMLRFGTVLAENIWKNGDIDSDIGHLCKKSVFQETARATGAIL
jgi:hypothetical protein